MLSYDELSEIMLHLDINSIKNLCGTNKQYSQFCENNHFWKNKLVHDKLPIIDNPSSIHDYIEIKNAYDKMLNYKNKNYLVLIVNEDLSVVFPESINEKIIFKNYEYAKLYIHLFENSYTSAMINYESHYKGKRLEMHRFKFSKQDLLDLLFRVFYYYPDVIVSNY